MAFQSAYDYDCEISFNLKDQSVSIMKECVKYMVIDHDYSKKIMPIIYMKISLPAKIYNVMVPQQGVGKIFLRLYSKKQNVTSATPKNYIYDEFDYYMTDDPNAFRKLDEVDVNSGQAYKDCMIGLIKTELTQQNQRNFSGIYKNTNTVSLVQSATSHMKMVMQPFKNNIQLESFSCPSIGSVGQFISYINSQYSFYNGSYIYFMDFDKTYLRSNDGSYIDAKDGGYPYIAFDIRDLTQYQAQTVGIVDDYKQKAYIIYINAANAHIGMDRAQSQLTGSVVSINAEGSTESVQIDTSAITSIQSSIDGSTVVRSDDPNAAQALASTIEESAGTLMVSKTDMDARIFTPNKQYLLSNYEDNPTYCGIYYMTYKKEIYLRSGPILKSLIYIGLRKTSDFVGKSNINN